MESASMLKPKSHEKTARKKEKIYDYNVPAQTIWAYIGWIELCPLPG